MMANDNTLIESIIAKATLDAFERSINPPITVEQILSPHIRSAIDRAVYDIVKEKYGAVVDKMAGEILTSDVLTAKISEAITEVLNDKFRYWD